MARRRAKLLPERTPDDVLEAFPFWRQSALSDADTCMLRTLWRLEEQEIRPTIRFDRSWDSPEAARGVLAHRYAAEVLRTLWRTGNDSMSVAEGLEILYEVCAQRNVEDVDVVFLPARERRMLRMFAVLLLFSPQTKKLRRWNMSHLVDIEERRWAKVSYVHHATGELVERVITGQPDVTLADRNSLKNHEGQHVGLVVLDWKSTPKAPAKVPDHKLNETGHAKGDDVPGNVSYEGYFQQRVYGVLELVARPYLEYVTLREIYPMDPDGLQVRNATVYREDLERIERELGTIVGLLDRAIEGGSSSLLWKPQPGKHCSHCPRPGSCPIDREERGEGSIESMPQAEEWAEGMVVSKAVYDHRRGALKAFHEMTGLPIAVQDAKGRYELRYKEGTKNFGMYVPSASSRGPEDPNLSGIFREAAERKRAKA